MSLRKIFTALLIFVFIFSNAATFAQVPVAVPGALPSSLGELSRIGVVAAIQGKVEVMTPGAAGRVVQSGEKIFIGDEVKTDALGHLQILLLDETVFTIGPNSAITIDKFVYDPATHVGKVEASIAKGVFRYVSGKIAANKPENVMIKLPTATIGIRGTIVAGEASETRSMAMLLGPGSRNETGVTIGSFVMSGTGENSGQQEHVNRTGFGVSVDQAGSLSGVFMVPEVQVQHLGEALLPAPGRGPGPVGGESAQGAPPSGRAPGQGPSGAPAPGSGSATGGTAGGGGAAPRTSPGAFGAGFNAGQASGAQTYSGFQITNQVNMFGMFQNGLMQDSTLASQEAAHNAATGNNASQTFRETLQHDMYNRSAPAIVTYQNVSAPFLLGGISSVLNAFINVNFSTQELVGAGPNRSYFEIKQGAAVVDNCEFLGAQNFTTMESPIGNIMQDTAKFFLSGGSEVTQFAPAGTFNSITIVFQDVINQPADGTASQIDIAARAKVIVDYTSAASQNVVVETMAPQQ